jgi:hypothetical protein
MPGPTAKASNFQHTILSQLTNSSLYNKEEHADITFRYGTGELIYAHKAIICPQSHYFAQKYKETKPEVNPHLSGSSISLLTQRLQEGGRVTIRLERGLDFEATDIIIKYLYDHTFPQDRLDDPLLLNEIYCKALTFGIIPLAESAESFFETSCHKLNANGFGLVWHIRDLYKWSSSVRSQTHKFAYFFFHYIVEHEKDYVLRNMLDTINTLPELKRELLATMEAQLSQMVFTHGLEFKCPQCTEQAEATRSEVRSQRGLITCK